MSTILRILESFKDANEMLLGKELLKNKDTKLSLHGTVVLL